MTELFTDISPIGEKILSTDDESLEAITDEWFAYWRGRGFPDYSASYNIKREVSKLKSLDVGTLVTGDEIKQNMIGCGLLWQYFPNWSRVRCGGGLSPREEWDNDEKLKSLIKKTIKWEVVHANGILTENRMRQNAKVYLASQSVSNFRPSVAKYIYNTYGGENVWDMSCGFGGRLLGFHASRCSSYLGTEPNTETFNGLNKLKSDLSYLGKSVLLVKSGSEDYTPNVASLDLCFTSPPYFDTEMYSDEPTQSYIKFPTLDVWLQGFLRRTINNAGLGLKHGGYFIINIANTTKYKTLESEAVRFIQDAGLEYIKTYKMQLSSISGKGVKHEPIFVFKKQ